MDLSTDLLTLFLPKLLVDYFRLTNHNRKSDILHLYFEELNIPPEEFVYFKLHSKGFHKEIKIQDFPLRGHRVYLHIKRRRWLVLDTDKLVERNWNLVAKGTRMTEEFSSFLKEINRY